MRQITDQEAKDFHKIFLEILVDHFSATTISSASFPMARESVLSRCQMFTQELQSSMVSSLHH